VADKKRATTELLALAEVLGAQLSASALALYLRAIEDLTDDQVRAACVAAARATTFHALPTPGELRKFAGVPAPGELAWDQVIGCLSRGGGWVELPLPTRRALAAIGGSSRVTTADDQRGLGALRGRFLEAFMAQTGPDAFDRHTLATGVRLAVKAGGS
jgi:hypothetical protein